MKIKVLETVLGVALVMVLLAFNPLLQPLLYFDNTASFFFLSNIKVVLLSLLNLGLLFYWGIKIYKTKELALIPSKFYMVLVAFITVTLISFIFSENRNNTLFGFNALLSNSLIEFINLILFFFIFVNLIRSHDSIKYILRFVGAAFSIVSLWIIARFTSSWNIDSVFFSNYLNNPQFSPTGVMKTLLPMFLSVFLFSFIFVLQAFKEKKLHKLKIGLDTFNLLFSGIGFVNLLNVTSSFINHFFITAGIIVISCCIYYVIMTPTYKKLLLQTVLIFVAVVTIGFAVYFSLTKELLVKSQRQPLSLDESWNIAQSSMNESFIKGLIGNGAGNYPYLFDSYKNEYLALYSPNLPYKSININYPSLFEKRLNHSDSYLFEIMATNGWLGVLAFVMVFGYLLFLYYKNWNSINELGHFLALALIIILASTVRVGYDFTLLFSLWLFSALLFTLINEKTKPRILNISLTGESTKSKRNLSYILPILMSLFAVFTIFYGVKFMIANASIFWAKRFENIARVALSEGDTELYKSYYMSYQNSALDAVNAYDKSDVFLRELIYSNAEPLVNQLSRLQSQVKEDLSEDEKNEILNQFNYLNSLSNGILANLDYAIRLFPQEYKNYFLKAELLSAFSSFAQNKLDDAARDNYEIALFYNKFNFVINLRLSNIYQRNGDFRNALIYLNQGSINPALTLTLPLELNLRRAEINTGLGNYDEAIGIYNFLLEQDLSQFFISIEALEGFKAGLVERVKEIERIKEEKSNSQEQKDNRSVVLTPTPSIIQNP